MTLSRRHFFLGSLSMPAFAAKKPAGERPNVLLILADALPAWVLGCYGNREVRTPNIDRLAQTGMRFLNHFAGAPVAEPARATLVSGRTAMQLGDAGTLSSSDVSLDKLLAGLGYSCHAANAAEAGKFVDEQSPDKPFFLTARFSNLQPPYEGVAPRHRDLYTEAKFETFSQEAPAANAQLYKELLSDLAGNQRKVAGAVTMLDDEVGALLARLPQRRLLDHTLVLLTSPCGSLFGRHGLWNSGQASDPVNMYEEVVATPMLWSWPGHVPAQAMRPEVVSAHDLIPTLCDLTGADQPQRNLCGRSYLLLATGKPLPKKQPWRAVAFAHYQNTSMARIDRYKIVLRNNGKGPNELYDVRTDPRERVNQYDNQQFLTVRNSLTAELGTWKQRYSA